MFGSQNTEQTPITWFVDERLREMVLKTDGILSPTNKVVDGSKEVLVHEVRKGGDIRLKVQLNGKDYYAVVGADNLEIKDGEIAAMHLRTFQPRGK